MKFKVNIHHTPKSNILCAIITKNDDAILFIDNCKKYDALNNIHWQYSINAMSNPVFINNCEIDEPFVVTTNLIVSSSSVVAFMRSMMEVHLFLEAKFISDVEKTQHNIYYVFHRGELIKEYDKNPKSSQQNEKQKVFRPTPLPNKPRLGPGGYWVDPEDDDK